MDKGIDYGRGQTNIDRETGIRFGVIPMDSLNPWAWESFEGDYGEPSCPKCGNDAVDYDDEKHGEYPYAKHDCTDYACESCEYGFGSDSAFGYEPNGHVCTDSDYTATVDSYNDAFILKAPYYTRAQFCSPCAPGACYLTNPCELGEKAYCFGPDWFDDKNPCPYPVWDVKTDELIYAPKDGEESESSDE